MLGNLLTKLQSLRTWWSPSFTASSLQALGQSNADVWRFQRVFNARASRYGLRIEVTGIYDEQTRVAVRSYQRLVLRMVGTADGFVGPQTARKLRIRLRED